MNAIRSLTSHAAAEGEHVPPGDPPPGSFRALTSSLAPTPLSGHMALLLWQLLFGTGLCVFLGRGYLAYIPPGTPIPNRIVNFAAFVSTCVLLNFVAWLAAAPPAAMIRRSWFTLGVAPLPFAFVSVFVYVDAIVYELFRFHLNGMVLNLLTTRGSSDSYTLGPRTILSGLTSITSIVAAHAAFSLAALPWLRQRGLLPRPGRLAAWAVPSLALVILADKTCFLLGDLYNVPEITRVRHLFPLYRPVVVRQFARDWLGIEIARENHLHIDHASDTLAYPRAPLVFPAGGRRPNIVLIAIEGCRYDMLDPEIMPFLDRWSRGQLRFERHTSGGNASRFGIFSLLYGIYGTYWHKALAERHGPVLISELKRLGYSFRIFSCDDLNFPEFRKTTFIDVPDAITDRWDGARVDRDRMLTDRLVESIGAAKAPFFAFAFYDASHQPYLFPPEHRVFEPVLDKAALDYTTLAEEKRRVSPLLLNRYKNSLHYVDSQIERVVAEIERRGLMGDTLVFITGDHGEEFNELGHHGHNNAFDRYQTRTIMVAHVPGEESRQITRMTSHLDVVPTIFTFMGVPNPVADYGQGTSLTDPTGPRFAVSASWDDAAIVTETSTLVFGTDSTSVEFDVFDGEYRPIPSSQGPGQDLLLEVVRRMREFSH